MKFKTVVVVGTSVAAGMVVSNYLTNGAVLEAATEVVNNVKDRFFTKSNAAIEVVGEVVESAGDAVREATEESL